MTDAKIAATPDDIVVFRVSVRFLGRALRPELLALAGLLGVATFIGFSFMILEGAVLDYPDELSVLIPLVAFLLPFRLWSMLRLFDRSDFWTLPVERQKHVLIRVGAGGVWVLGLTSLVVVWFNVLAVMSGGLKFSQWAGLSASTVMASGLYLAPFGAAVVAYLFGSALAIGLRYPVRWVLGAALVSMIFIGMGPDRLASSMAQTLGQGYFGLDAVLTGGIGVWREQVQHAGASAILDPPSTARWLMALTLWLGAGLALVGAASARHRERG